MPTLAVGMAPNLSATETKYGNLWRLFYPFSGRKLERRLAANHSSEGRAG
jgi:hypothetical protein